MASYAGILNPVPEYLEFADRSTNISGYTPEFGDIWDTTISFSGILQQNQLVKAPDEHWIGILIDSFLTDFYNHIYIYEVENDFGFVSSEVQDTFIVWNAYLEETKSCLSIDSIFPADAVISGLAAPFTMLPTKQLIYTVTVPVQGNYHFSTYYTFNFDTENPFIHFFGIRMALFSWRPQAPVNETLEWLTDLLVAKIGCEQRIALRKIPRQAFSFQGLTVTEQEQAALDAYLWKFQSLTWGLPIWTELKEHLSTIAINDMAISVDTNYADFVAGGAAAIWQNKNLYELISIKTVNANSLELNYPILHTWTGYKLIIPVRPADLTNVLGRGFYVRDYTKIQYEFALKEGTLLTGFTPVQSYLEIPIITEASIIDNLTLDGKIDGQISMTDFDTGNFDIWSDREAPEIIIPHRFANDTSQACWEFRKWLHSMCGRQGVVWVPTFRQDLKAQAQIGDNENTFSIDNIGFSRYYGLNDYKKYLAFFSPDGTIACRRITGVTETNSTTESVTIDSALGVVFAATSKISFLHKCRLNADRVEFIWNEAGQNECALDFSMVKE